jgi:uncharacterized protein (UPF0332 family)
MPRRRIFWPTYKVAKTHSGVRSEFARVAKDDPTIERKLASFLAQSYSLKVIADYAVAIEGATRFVEAVDRTLSETR